MRLPVSWLKEYIKFDISAEELAHRLALTGQDVDTVEDDVIFDGIVIGEVIEREKHPNADKLNVAKVNVGKETLQIVCGAPNLNVGQKVPVALVGAKLGDFEISKVELRGIESSGMICSEKELGIGENHDGIMILEKQAKVGTDFGEYLGREKVIDIKTAANRPDCMGIIGLAREVGATLGKRIKVPDIKINENKNILSSGLVNVEIKAKELCPKYIARVVKGVKVGPSPKWLQERLLSVNVRPINNLVDISNYVMFETGQPLHFFDLKKITDGGKAEIIIRKAKQNEELVTLDGIKRKLTDDMLVIADKKRAVALAGVMGGENTEVDENTVDVLVEAAVFEKSNIRRTSRKLGLRSEAVARFEKGIPVESPQYTIKRAVELLLEIAGGDIASGEVVSGEIKSGDKSLKLNLNELNNFVGIEIPKNEVIRVFENLEIKTVDKGDSLDVNIPWWRRDLSLPVDLFEEVVRIWGFEKITPTLPKVVTPKIKQNESYLLNKKIRHLLSNIGLNEILTYSFIGGKDLEAVGEDVKNAPKLSNPLVAEQEYMRTSLVPHLLMAVRDNQFNKDDLKLFEIGKKFTLKQKQLLPKEEKQLVISVTEKENFYVLKGIIERLFADLNLEVKYERTENPLFINGSSAAIYYQNDNIGSFGEVKKTILNTFDVKKDTAVLVLNLDKVEFVANSITCFEEFSKFPKVTRDLSVIIPVKQEIGIFESEIPKVDELIYDVKISDIYQGKPLGQNEKSITVRIEIWSNEKTLTDAEVDTVMKKCEKQFVKFGGIIRGAKKH